MFTKRNAIVGLAVVNLVLLVGLILSISSLPAAHAQGVGRAGNFMMVAGEIQDGNDALYVFDLRNRLVHVFTVGSGNRIELIPQYTRDLVRDFRGPRR